MKRALRLGRSLFQARKSSFAGLVTGQRQAHRTAVVLVQVYYAFTLVLFIRWLSYHWPIWLDSREFDLLWPVAWLPADPALAVYAIGFFCLGSGLLAALFPSKRWTRLLVFVAFLLFSALWNSFGKINHSLHAWLWTAFLFVLLPDDGWQSEESSVSRRQPFLLIFWGAQLLLALFYSMSGLIKFYGAIDQIAHGQISALHPDGLAYVVANRLLQNGSESLLGPLIVTYPILGWPFYAGAIFIELLALMAVFRPSLHRLWGVGLFLLHLGNWLILSILFDDQMALCLLLLVYSPFRTPLFNRQKS